MPIKLYELFEYYKIKANRNDQFNIPDSYDGTHYVGYNTITDSIHVYNVNEDCVPIDVANYVTSIDFFETDLKPKIIRMGQPVIPKNKTIPTKVYELFNHYGHTSNQKDLFIIPNDGIIGYENGSIEIIGLLSNEHCGPIDITSYMESVGMLKVHIARVNDDKKDSHLKALTYDDSNLTNDDVPF